MRQVICWFVYIGKNPRFTAFLNSILHTRLPIVTENELGLAFTPRNLPEKIRPDPSTFYLVIVVTNRETNRQTNAGDYIIPRESFRGDNNCATNIIRSLTECYDCSRFSQTVGNFTPTKLDSFVALASAVWTGLMIMVNVASGRAPVSFSLSLSLSPRS